MGPKRRGLPPADLRQTQRPLSAATKFQNQVRPDFRNYRGLCQVSPSEFQNQVRPDFRIRRPLISSKIRATRGVRARQRVRPRRGGGVSPRPVGGTPMTRRRFRVLHIRRAEGELPRAGAKPPRRSARPSAVARRKSGTHSGEPGNVLQPAFDGVRREIGISCPEKIGNGLEALDRKDTQKGLAVKNSEAGWDGKSHNIRHDKVFTDKWHADEASCH